MNCTNVPIISDHLTYILGSTEIIITLITITGNTTMVLFVNQKRNSSKNMFFFKLVLAISMTAVTAGQPLEIINIMYKTKITEIDLLSNFILFLTFSGIYHSITCHAFQRYFQVKQKQLLLTTSKKIIFTFAFIFYILLINLPIFMNLHEIIMNRANCEKPPTATLAITITVTWITYCSLIIYVLTRKAILFVHNCDKIRQERLGKTDKINIKRLLVMKRIWAVFSLLWLPYGCVNSIRDVVPVNMYEILNPVARTIAFVSFSIISVVFYLTDNNYARYIKRQLLNMKVAILGKTEFQIETERGSTYESSKTENIVPKASDENDNHDNLDSNKNDV